MISLIGNTVGRGLLYYVEHKPLQFPLIVHYLYMSFGASTKTIYVFFKIVVNGFQVAGKAQLNFSL